jgi:hypothetical protein
MVSDWPRPNVLLSAIALGSLEQLGHSLEKQYPFLIGLVHEVGAGMYANFEQLPALQRDDDSKKNRFLVYFQHGRPWFQALAGEQQMNLSLRASDTSQRDEIERLSGELQEQKAAHLVEKMQDRVKRAVRSREATREDPRNRELELEAACHSALPLLARLLLHGDDDSADDTLPSLDSSFQDFVREMTRVFASLRDTHALKLLRALLDAAISDREHKPLAEVLAIAVDALDEPARREFLREYFAFVAHDELQDALRERDESNDAKRLSSFVDELFDSLGLDPDTCIHSGSTTFHSDQARVIKSVLDRTELLQEIAAEFCFLDENTSARALPEDLRQRLRAFETPARRILKAQQLMASSSSSPAPLSSPSKDAAATCLCTCGNHRLVGVDEHAEEDDAKANRSPSGGDDGNSDSDARQRRKTRRRSSAGARRRKNGVNFGNQLASSAYGKRASTSLRIFPLAEVCRLLTSILHLQFSRDAVDESSAYLSLKRAEDDGVSVLSTEDDRWVFLRRAPKPSFKTLARDFLTRKYGIKSIAVMHSLQLERSLVHYAALLNHTRCDLFAWFLGADRSPTRLASRDYAFRFFQRLVKTLLKLLASKKSPLASSSLSIANGSVSMALSPLPPSQTPLAVSNPLRPSAPLAYSVLVSVWTESIGDGEISTSSSADAKSLPPAVAIEACRLVFPRCFQDDHPAFGALLERFYRVGLDKKPVELEGFLRRAMDAWQAAFEAFEARISDSIQQVGRLDFDAFGQCLTTNGLELTGGERLELFDLLTNDSDAFGNMNDEDDGGGGAAVVAKKRAEHFLLEAKYLLPVS